MPVMRFVSDAYVSSADVQSSYPAALHGSEINTLVNTHMLNPHANHHPTEVLALGSKPSSHPVSTMLLH